MSRHGEVRHALLNMGHALRNLTSRPTHVSELVQSDHPDYIGYCDASVLDSAQEASGLGGNRS
jgi:hypothetical protein